MKFKFDFKKITELRNTRALRGLGSLEHVERDWRYVLVFFLAINIFILVASMTLFYRISTKSIFQARRMDHNALGTVDREKLEDTLRDFRERAVLYDALRRSPPSRTDPSL